MARVDEAGEYYRRATIIDDSYAPALLNYASYLVEGYKTTQGEFWLLKAQRQEPDSPYIFSGLGRLEMFRGRIDRAVDYSLLAWLKGFGIRTFGQTYIFNCSYSSSMSERDVVAEHRFWAETQAFAPDGYVVPDRQGRRKGKIRIGYLSPDLRQHSVMFFFGPLLEGHNKEEFEVYVYNDGAIRDAQTERVQAAADYYRDVCNFSDEDVLRVIRGDDLDVLVELAGHTSVSRLHLFNRRMARVQMTALGYPPTTGLHAMDYKVLDVYAAPFGSDEYYSERVLRLPGSFWCFNPFGRTPDVVAPPVSRRGYITFGCFGNISKITDVVLSLWARVMAEVQGARLVVKSISFQDPDIVSSFGERLSCFGIEVQRFDLVPPDPADKLYEAYSDIDIVLDTYPFNGGTTSCFALWMGVPVITMAGSSLVSRMGVSMMMNLGLPECVSYDLEGYVAAAVALSADVDRLSSMRFSIRDKMLSSSLGNGRLYAGDFERACKEVLVGEGERQKGIEMSEDVLISRAGLLLGYGDPAGALAVLDYFEKVYAVSEGSVILRSSSYEALGRLADAEMVLRSAIEMEFVRVNYIRLLFRSGRYSEVAKEAIDYRFERSESLFMSNAYRRVAMALEGGAVGREQSVSNAVILVGSDYLDSAPDGVLGFSSVPELLSICEELCAADPETPILIVFGEFELLMTNFVSEMVGGLACCDVLGGAGGRGLRSQLWFDSEVVAGGVVRRGVSDGYSLFVYGDVCEKFSSGFDVLAGGFLALKAASLVRLGLDERLGFGELQGVDLSLRAAAQGMVLGVAPCLGVALQASPVCREGEYFCDKHGVPLQEEYCAPKGLDMWVPDRAAAAVALETLYSGLA